MMTPEVVSVSKAKQVLARMKKGDKHTLAEEAEHLGLSGTRPLREALVKACGGKAGYRKVMGERRYPRKTKEERVAAVKEKLLAAGVKKVVVRGADDGTAADDDDGGIAEDGEEAEVADCVDEMSGGRGRAWAEEYWSAGSSGDTQAEVDGGAGTAVVS